MSDVLEPTRHDLAVPRGRRPCDPPVAVAPATSELEPLAAASSVAGTDARIWVDLLVPVGALAVAAGLVLLVATQGARALLLLPVVLTASVPVLQGRARVVVALLAVATAGALLVTG